MNAWMRTFGLAAEHVGCGNLMSRITLEGAEQSDRRPLARLGGRERRGAVRDGSDRMMQQEACDHARQPGQFRSSLAALSAKTGRAKGPVNRTGRSIAGKRDQAS
jgi:hypothetical protein